MKFLIIVALLLSLCACGDKQKNEQAKATDQINLMQDGFNANKPKTPPKLDTSKKTYKKLDLYNQPSKSGD